VLEATKARTRRLHALLGEGRPVALAEDGLTLEFRPGYGYHAEYCAKDTSQATLAEVFAEVFGTPLRVRCQIAEPRGPGLAGSDEADEVAESEAAAAAGELPDPEQAYAAAVETLTRAFGATPLDRDGP
jgi:hypothetical protein